MYRVYFYRCGGTNLSYKDFETYNEATEFANKQPMESVTEIKQYEFEANYTKD